MSQTNDAGEKAMVKHDLGFSRNTGLQLTSLTDLWRFAQAVARSGLAPKSFHTPDQVLVAVQIGAEVGMTPMQSLQGIAVINGKATLWGDAMPGLVYKSGMCEYIREAMEGEGDDFGCTIRSKRKDMPDELVTRFTVGMAKEAGLLNKPGPWKQYPERMMKMRARAWNLRDNFADVLQGMSVREEVQDYAVVAGEPAEAEEPEKPPTHDPLADDTTDAEIVPPAEPQATSADCPPKELPDWAQEPGSNG